jgi:hypothetical protein
MSRSREAYQLRRLLVQERRYNSDHGAPVELGPDVSSLQKSDMLLPFVPPDLALMRFLHLRHLH